HDDQEHTFVGGEMQLPRSQRESITKLVLVGEYQLSGSLTSMAKIKTTASKTGGDCLLLGFKDAKLSLVQWDPAINGISTISVHYYEQEEFKSTFMPEHMPSQLSADPSSRCAVLKFNLDMMAILRFRQREDEDLILGDADGNDDYDPDSMFKEEEEEERKAAAAAANAMTGDATGAANASTA